MPYDPSTMTIEPTAQARGGVELWRIGGGDHRRASVPGGLELETVIGARPGRPFGLLDVTVSARGAMPEHDHGASEALLILRSGALQLVEATCVTELVPGTVATIPVGCRVRLVNAGEEDAHLLVVLSPADFLVQLQGSPATEVSGTPG